MTTQKIRRRRRITDLDAEQKKKSARQANVELGLSGIYPLDAPGMPAPGMDFIEHAKHLGDNTEFETETVTVNGRKKKVEKVKPGDQLEELYRRALRQPGFNMPIEVRPSLRQPVTFVPGHIWGQNMQAYINGDHAPVDGPSPADVMIIGKMPGEQEEKDLRCLVGDAGELLLNVLKRIGVQGTPKWYVTNLCKFRPPDGSTRLKSRWLQDCLPLLHQELRIVRPKYILCLGTDASKALLGDKATVSNMEGRVESIRYPIHTKATTDKDEELYREALVMTIVHPAAVSKAGNPATERELERGVSRFNMLQQGIRWDKKETDIDHRWIYTLEDLDALLYEIRHDETKKDNIYSIDAEWHGEHPCDAGSYVRTIQFSWKPKCGCAIVLNDVDGKPCFRDKDGKLANKRAINRLNKFFKNKRVGGHFLVADLEWLCHEGLDIRDSYRPPLFDERVADLSAKLARRYRKFGFEDDDLVPAWFRSKYEGGWDTGTRAHAIEETAQLKLESLLMRYTDCPRYDVPLMEWRVEYCRSQGINQKDLEGYGPCPDDVLIPYGIYDADATLRLYYAQEKLLDSDYDGNCCREPAWESHIACLPILEMHQNGICIDKARIDDLTAVFLAARDKQQEKIREWAKWPDFNIRSVFQVREFLYGYKYNGKRQKDGKPVRQSPEDSVCLNVRPILDTSKPPKRWEEIAEKGKEEEHNPSTNKTTLGVLAQDNDDVAEQIRWLRDFRFLDQVLKGVLRPPMTDNDGAWLTEDSVDFDTADTSVVDNITGQGGLIYDAGLASVIGDDGRVRTHLYPTTETGRWRSARPNLQNLSKRRDDDYLRMLGKDQYKHKLRSIMMASPGHLMIECDYTGAELFGMAILSGDTLLIEHATRNQLPEDDPNHYDIHSNIAVLAFGLDCPPTKKGMKEAGKSAYRIHAKNVVFGIAYGRQAKAIALQAKEEGNPISVAQAQTIIDTVFSMYPKLKPFFAECRRRATTDGWVCNCFGRLRRFPATTDFKQIGDFERQAQNYPVQSFVASAVDRAAAYLQYYRDEHLQRPDLFRMLLQIHDALVIEAPYAYVDEAAEALRYCMEDLVPIYPTDLAGNPLGTGPYYLRIDTTIEKHWGEDINQEQIEKYGIPEQYLLKAA